MKFFDNYIVGFFSVFYLVLLVWAGVLFFTGQINTEWNYLFNTACAVLYFSVGIVALFGIELHGLKSSVGRELLAISLGMFGFSFGLFVWAYFNLILKVETPYPSLADFFFVLYIPFIGYGILNLLSVFGMFYSKRILGESAAIFLVAAVFIFFLGNPPDLSASLPFLEKSLNIFYLLGDAFLITLGYMLIRLTRGRIHQSFFFLIGALIIMAVADLLFAYRTSAGIYWNGDIADILYATSGFLFSVGVTKIVLTQIKISNSLRVKE